MTEVSYMKEPVVFESHNVVSGTVKFDQGLKDGFFSVKKHALIASVEELRKLQGEFDHKPKSREVNPPSDPDGVKKRLDEALAEADRQSQRSKHLRGACRSRLARCLREWRFSECSGRRFGRYLFLVLEKPMRVLRTEFRLSSSRSVGYGKRKPLRIPYVLPHGTAAHSRCITLTRRSRNQKVVHYHDGLLGHKNPLRQPCFRRSPCATEQHAHGAEKVPR